MTCARWSRAIRAVTRASAAVDVREPAQPRISYQVIINLIAATTSSSGLKVYARLDDNAYPDKIHVSDQRLAAVNLQPPRLPRRLEHAIKPSPN